MNPNFETIMTYFNNSLQASQVIEVSQNASRVCENYLEGGVVNAVRLNMVAYDQQ